MTVDVRVQNLTRYNANCIYTILSSNKKPMKVEGKADKKRLDFKAQI